jgi:hypothetical protein
MSVHYRASENALAGDRAGNRQVAHDVKRDDRFGGGDGKGGYNLGRDYRFSGGGGGGGGGGGKGGFDHERDNRGGDRGGDRGVIGLRESDLRR